MTTEAPPTSPASGGPPPPAPPGPGGGRGGRGGGGRGGLPKPSGRQLVLTVLAVAVVAAAGSYAVNARHQNTQVVTSGGLTVSGGDPGRLAAFMRLSSAQGHPAAGFSFTDQRGVPVSLAGLRGHAVVLDFMDPHCTDICPIVSHEFVDAARNLGARAADVEFVAINVNPYHTDQASVAAFSAEQGLNALPNWHFLTGPLPALRQAWHDYGIAVQAPNPDADVVHSDDIYFIDPQGHEQWVALPQDRKTAAGTAYLPPAEITRWGQGIARFAASLLPPR